MIATVEVEVIIEIFLRAENYILFAGKRGGIAQLEIVGLGSAQVAPQDTGDMAVAFAVGRPSAVATAGAANTAVLRYQDEVHRIGMLQAQGRSPAGENGLAEYLFDGAEIPTHQIHGVAQAAIEWFVGG